MRDIGKEIRNMKSIRGRIFQNATKDKTYYWLSVTSKDKDDKSIQANIFVRMSKDAAVYFEKISETTKTKGIYSAYVEVTDGWLKAVPGKEHNNVVLFVNDLKKVE